MKSAFQPAALLVALLAASLGLAHAADPVVSNRTAAQHAGTKLVESSATSGNLGGPSANREETPKGLSNSDWASIRDAYEKNRHAIFANPDGTHQARNPGQAWMTKFDGRGFTVTPDGGGWSWGLELAGYGTVPGVTEEGGRISFARGDGLTEWFINDARGLEQG